MKAIGNGLYRRGIQATIYLRKRIPAHLRRAYPEGQDEKVVCLRTSDLREAKTRAVFERARIEAEFEQKRVELDLQRASTRTERIRKLTDSQLESVVSFWSHQVLTQDERRRDQMDDEEFDALGNQLREQRSQLGRMQAQGRVEGIFPALKSFLFLCGLEFDPEEPQSRRVAQVFLQGVLKTLDVQIRRHSGEIVATEEVAPVCAHPLHAVVPELAPRSENPWERLFLAWSNQQVGRPPSTVIAYRTAWEDLIDAAREMGMTTPSAVTADVVRHFKERMRARKLTAKTAKGRIAKVRYIYKLGMSDGLVQANPAEHIVAYSEHRLVVKARKRLPLDLSDLQLLFGSAIYTRHLRSRGQAGEATYWIPLIMFYTGARPEEIAGLALCDVQHHPILGWYFDIVDRAPPHLENEKTKADKEEDEGLFSADDDDDDQDDETDYVPEFDDIPLSHRRMLKNGASARKVPISDQLIEMGLLRYVEWLREQNATVLFPTLTKDSHGKLSGAFAKFFTRFKRNIGITDPRKVLYSLRHGMKDLLEQAGFNSKYLKRMMGHISGDGSSTDHYGSDVPFGRMVRYFRRVQFPEIPALPWEPGRGFWLANDRTEPQDRGE